MTAGRPAPAGHRPAEDPAAARGEAAPRTAAGAIPAQQGPADADAPAHFWPVDHLPALDFDPLLHRLLREEPVARVRMRHGEGEAWLVTSYDLVKEVTSDPRFSRALTVDRPVTSMTPHTIAPAGGIGRTDPPDHTRLRRLVSQAFGRKRVAALRAEAEQTADRLVAAMAAQGPPADLAEAVTGPMPEHLLGSLLGLPADDFGRLQQWRTALLSTDRSRQEGDGVKAEIAAYVRELAAHRARFPGDDLFSDLVAAHARGELSRPELVSLTVMVVLNALDQILGQATAMVYALLTHPRELERLRAEPALLPRAVEELLRFLPQRNGVGMPRIATEDVEVGGRVIRAGEAVYVSYPAADRDPRVFGDPDRLDLARTEAPHLAFGHGAHYCLGAALARMECEVVLAALLRELPGLRLAVAPEAVPWRRGTVNRGPEALPLAW
ncbi:cytochrome P450 [Streptomyces sp. NPDC046866]|uniref:cytochrome P450 n=1 Tax=Streptomyces sp. NPDC046866 TaxID=3154921 RepID=UPI003451D56D